MRDIHLAGASIGSATKEAVEKLGFSEDFFKDCRNCTPTIYHATFRGSIELIDEALWQSVAELLRADATFNGILELEETKLLIIGGEVASNGALPPALKTQDCPVDMQKACDVHIGIRLDDFAEPTLEWLDALAIASFVKDRDDGSWRIYTATFDQLSSGESFFNAIAGRLPRERLATFKAKLEKTERVLRQPKGATTLPLTYTHQLDAWLAAGAHATTKYLRRVV